MAALWRQCAVIFFAVAFVAAAQPIFPAAQKAVGGTLTQKIQLPRQEILVEFQEDQGVTAGDPFWFSYGLNSSPREGLDKELVVVQAARIGRRMAVAEAPARFWRVNLPEGADAQAVVADLLRNPRVRAAELPIERQFIGAPPPQVANCRGFLFIPPGTPGVPNDPRLCTQGQLLDINAFAGWQTVEPFVQSAIGGPTRVAVLDTGADVIHPELVGRIDSRSRNVADNNSDIMDTAGHGTGTLGEISAIRNNNFGIAGLYDGKALVVRIVSQVHPDLFTSQIVAGILYTTATLAASNGAVINASFGSNFPSQIEEDAIREAGKVGILVSAGAGNGGVTDKFYPAAYPLWNVIAVGASVTREQTALGGTLHKDSQRGTWVHLLAPGSSNGTLDITKGSPNGGFSSDAGTSFSAPLVAGVAAWLMAMGQTPAEAKRSILHSVKIDPALRGLIGSAGILDFGRAVSGDFNPDCAPVPVFSVPVRAPEGTDVTLDASASYDPEGDSFTTRINPGDGSVEIFGPTAVHRYAMGSYFPSVTLENADGVSASASSLLIVTDRVTILSASVNKKRKLKIEAVSSQPTATFGQVAAIFADGNQTPIAGAWQKKKTSWKFTGTAPAGAVSVKVTSSLGGEATSPI